MAVQLRGPDLLHTGDHAADRGPRTRRTGVGPGARREDRPGPARASTRPARHPLLRHGGVRPVLAGVREGGHSGVDARVRLGLCRVPQRLGAPRRVPAVQATAFRMVSMGKRPIEDSMAALVCHGALTRNPDLRVLSIENGADWVPYLFHQFENTYKKMPQAFPEDPVAAFKRGVYVAPFWEDDFAQMADLCGIDRV